jgi:predicted  nucleic acid-binding Zn-ribbon protein
VLTAANKQSMKDLHIQMQIHKELLTKLQPELELKKVRKAELEAELRTLTAEIEADEKKIAELPESMEKIRKEATAVITQESSSRQSSRLCLKPKKLTKDCWRTSIR